MHEGQLGLGTPVEQVAVLGLVPLAERGTRHQLQAGANCLHDSAIKVCHGPVANS